MTELKDSEESRFWERMKIAKLYGWTIKRSATGYTSVSSPKNFACSEWTCMITTIKYKNGELFIPHYFWNDHVLKHGTRFDIPNEQVPADPDKPIAARTRSHK